MPTEYNRCVESKRMRKEEKGICAGMYYNRHGETVTKQTQKLWRIEHEE